MIDIGVQKIPVFDVESQTDLSFMQHRPKNLEKIMDPIKTEKILESVFSPL